jgi:hypothetical protein
LFIPERPVSKWRLSLSAKYGFLFICSCAFEHLHCGVSRRRRHHQSQHHRVIESGIDTIIIASSMTEMPVTKRNLCSMALLIMQLMGSLMQLMLSKKIGQRSLKPGSIVE